MLDGLRGWWRAEPWRVYPWARDGWRYRTLYRRLRRGSWWAERQRYLAGGEPKGRLRSLWGALSFPHVHDDDVFAFDPDWTVAPGETLRELLDERDMTPKQLAIRTYLDEPTVYEVLSGLPLTEAVAIELERAFGDEGPAAEFWLALERNHRKWIAKHRPGMTVDLATDARTATLAEESMVDTSRCEFCSGPLDAKHPWRRGRDGACAHEACL